MIKNVVFTRGDLTTAPSRVVVKYNDPKRDDQINSQSSPLFEGGFGKELVTELPLRLSASRAKQLAEVFAKTAHSELNSCEFELPLKYLEIDPTDVITLVGEDGSRYTVRVLDCTFDGIKTSVKAVVQDSVSYQSDADADGGDFPDNNINSQGPSYVVVMDIPALTSSEGKGSTLYVASYGVLPDWRGCVVFKSVDRAAWVEVGANTQGSTIGSCVGSFWQPLDSRQYDSVSKLTVKIAHGSLESRTLEEVLLSSSVNAAAISSNSGWELFQFVNANLIAANTYELTGFIRGAIGTEDNTSHSEGDTFVLLDKTIIPVATNYAVETYIAAATFSKPLDASYAVPQVPEEATLKPLAPVQVSAIKTPTSTVVKFQRRSMIQNGLLTTDPTDSILIEVYQSSILLNSYSIPTDTQWEYTSAMQTEDGVAAGVLEYHVYAVASLIKSDATIVTA